MIKFENVTKIYPGAATPALDNVNLTINDGDFVSIIGLSGAGKSTLLRCINKMHDIQEGKVLIDEQDISAAKGKELRVLRRNIGMIFQSFNLVKRSSVYKNVLGGRAGYHSFFEVLFGIYKEEEKRLAFDSLNKLGILDKAFVRADELSGGQQQRVALARALTQEPHIILADEPVASLDPITTISVMNDFKRINEDYKITIVANMHHVDLALKYSTRIIGINKGKIVFDGKPEEINDEILLKIYGRALKSNEKLGEVHEDEN